MSPTPEALAPEFHVRPARESEIPAIVALLSDDALGAAREGDPHDPAYVAAFHAIEEQRGNTLYVAVEGARIGGEIVGCFQLIFLPGISWKGASRVEVENVRIASSRRGGGLGGRMVAEAVKIAREGGGLLLQLTSNAARPDAHRFWRQQGFEQSHAGFKMML